MTVTGQVSRPPLGRTQWPLTGEPFDERSGLPAALAPTTVPVTWYRHACAFVDLKWPHASPRHRKGIAEVLRRYTNRYWRRNDLRARFLLR